MRKWLPIVLVIAAVAASLFVYPKLPEVVPQHWDMHGNVNSNGSKFTVAFIIPLVMAFIYLLMRVLPHIDPRKENYSGFLPTFEWIFITIMATLLGMHLALLATATGRDVNMGLFVPGMIGLLFIALGFLLPKAKSNWFVGIRTPWTLSSDLAWEKTHKLGGTLFMIAGAIVVLAAFTRPIVAHLAIGVSIGLAALSLVVYSYFVWRDDPARKTM